MTARLGGWWRLWIALSAVWAGIVLLDAGPLPRRTDSEYAVGQRYRALAESLSNARHGRFTDGEFAALPRDSAWDRLEAKVSDELSIHDSIITNHSDMIEAAVDRSHRVAVWEYVKQQASPIFWVSGVLLAVGLTLRWIWRGFVKAGV